MANHAETVALLPSQGDGKAPPMRHVSATLALGSAFLYGAAAVSMNFVNKLTLQVFGLANTLLFFQMSAVVLTIVLLKALNIVTFPAVNWQRAWGLAPVTLLYVSNVAFALMGLQNLNIPMYNTLKRLTPVIVLLTKAVQTKKAPPQDIAASVILVVAGCVVAGIGDFSFDLKGYVFALLSCLLQATYLILVEQSGAEKGVGTTELLYYNALLSLPFLIVVVLATGEASEIAPAMATAEMQMGVIPLIVLFLVFSLFGMLLNWSMFLCTMSNSALTTTIVGVLKGAVATLLGFFLLGGVEFHPLNVTGILINTLGGTWYTLIKYQQRQRRIAREASAALSQSIKVQA
ncbi:UDP-N-acetylglucosamine/UDP-glucose/GDP-mannose transporter [Coccomyxa sp. Obi]|nr:UDP-N-acetylglucosamine/UDP-glucose/GDP-mannose transporter [Coccomyxa sp. Obi]